MQLRMCVAEFKGAREVAGGKSQGHLSSALNSIMEGLRRFLNVTLDSSDKLGDWDPVRQRFDGCLGRLQSNKSDIHTPMVEFPILASGLRQGFVVLPSKITIISGYNSNSTSASTDVMDAFYSFDRLVWSMTIAFTFLISLMLFTILLYDQKLVASRAKKTWMKGSIRRRIRVPLNKVKKVAFGNIFKQHSAYNISYRLSTAGFALVIFAVFTFLIFNYFNCMIKTDMVVQKRPETISSYEEILSKPNVRPIWLSSLNDHLEFMNADPMTPEGRIWQRARDVFGIENCRVGSDIVALNQHSLSISSGMAVWFGASYMMDIMVTNACALSREFGVVASTNVWIKSDDRAREKLTGSMMTSSMPDKLQKLVHKLTVIAFEQRIVEQSLKGLNYALSRDTGSKALRDCVSNSIIYPEQKHSFPGVRHYWHLILISIMMLAASLIVLMIELFCRADLVMKILSGWPSKKQVPKEAEPVRRGQQHPHGRT